MTTRTPEEWSLMSYEARVAHLKAEELNVFGFDVKYDREGNPIEQGIGSKAQPSLNSIRAYERYCSDEENFAQNLAAMKKHYNDVQEEKRIEKIAAQRRAAKAAHPVPPGGGA